MLYALYGITEGSVNTIEILLQRDPLLYYLVFPTDNFVSLSANQYC